MSCGNNIAFEFSFIKIKDKSQIKWKKKKFLKRKWFEFFTVASWETYKQSDKVCTNEIQILPLNLRGNL